RAPSVGAGISRYPQTRDIADPAGVAHLPGNDDLTVACLRLERSAVPSERQNRDFGAKRAVEFSERGERSVSLHGLHDDVARHLGSAELRSARQIGRREYAFEARTRVVTRLATVRSSAHGRLRQRKEARFGENDRRADVSIQDQRPGFGHRTRTAILT